MLRTFVAALALLGLASAAQAQGAASGPQVSVTLTAPAPGPVSGRLIVVARPKPASTLTLPGGQTINVRMGDRVSMSPMSPDGLWVAAQEATGLKAGETLAMDTKSLAFPGDLSAAAPGTYVVQAVLDVNRNLGYYGLADSGDILSAVREVTLPLAEPLRLELSQFAAPQPAWDDTSRLGAQLKADVSAALPNLAMVEIPSAVMQAFSGKPTSIRAMVLTPPGYQAGTDRYPTVLSFDGFGGRLGWAKVIGTVQEHWKRMASGKQPPMIWILLDNEVPGGAHAFADSASNGPWGQALTTEFIPWLDRTYRTDGKPSGRFVAGHSTGGWAALWQQVKYPALYGGAWATAPDYVDFRRAWETDLYAPNANVYVHPSGEPKFIGRPRGDVPKIPVRSYTLIENVISEVGGQIASFDWVFSPRGPDGRPLRLFDHATGAVDPRVAQAWKAYDISRILEDTWTTGGSEIAKKLHIDIGTMDTYYLNEAVELMDANFKRRNAVSDIQLVAGKDHGSILSNGGDTYYRITENAWEMYAIARPGVSRPAAAVATAQR